MFVVRQAQIAALDADRRRVFAERLASHLHAVLPTVCAELGEAAVVARVGEAMTKAGRYEITTERDVASFAREVVFPFPQFDAAPEHRWMVEILERRSWPAAVRLSLIAKRRKAPA